MENRNDILNELKELSFTIAAIEKVNVFTVPDGYFENLSADILMGIETENGSIVNASALDSPVDVPTGYFETLSDSIMTKIKAQEADDAATEIRALSPMLYSIQNENVFEVPTGYFESLSDAVLNKVKPQPKVIAMQRRSTTFFKYAVAAAFTGIMALGVFKFTGNTNNKIDLPEYVTAGLQVQDVDQELAKISDADIIKFLEAGGTDVKAAYVANSVDENELPSQVDYLLDDKTLDTYLNSININDLKN
jgi:hypothetical protein